MHTAAPLDPGHGSPMGSECVRAGRPQPGEEAKVLDPRKSYGIWKTLSLLVFLSVWRRLQNQTRTTSRS